jgi:hypothetical protein
MRNSAKFPGAFFAKLWKSFRFHYSILFWQLTSQFIVTYQLRLDAINFIPVSFRDLYRSICSRKCYSWPINFFSSLDVYAVSRWVIWSVLWEGNKQRMCLTNDTVLMITRKCRGKRIKNNEQWLYEIIASYQKSEKF